MRQPIPGAQAHQQVKGSGCQLRGLAKCEQGPGAGKDESPVPLGPW